MIEDIVDLIKTDISTLNFIDKIGGIVKPLKIKKLAKDKSFTEKTIPVCFNLNKTKCDTSDYIDYCPNTKYKSVSYFEIQDINEVDSNAHYTQFEGVLRFVYWLNLPLINKTLSPINNINYEIMGVVPRKLNNTSPFVFCQIIGVDIKHSEDIFSKYSYDEAENQYLMFPFDFGALDFKISFRVPYSCISNVSLNPASC